MRIALTAILMVWLQAVAAAGTDAGAEAYARGDFKTAYRLWEPIARQGDAELQFKLGTMHEWGMGVDLDYREAVKWYRRAAEQGHVEAQFTLGFMYGAGQGVRQDEVQAYAWYDLAAARGHESAQEFRNATASRLARRQLAQAQRLARELDLRNTHDCGKGTAAGTPAQGGLRC